MSERSSPLRVLLVEDSPDDAELVQRALRTGGLEIDAHVVSTEQGLLAALPAFAPEVVLSDWALPGYSASEAVAAVHAWDASVPCILVSGTVGEELVVKALHSGATDYVVKGRLEALVPAVRRALGEVTERRTRIGLQEALIGSERRFREALSDVALVAVMLDTRGSVLFANRYLLELTGWGEADLVGQDWFDRSHPPESRGSGRAAYLEAVSRGTITPRWRDRLLTGTGQTRVIEWSSAFLRDETGSIVGLAGLGNDVTEREATQASLESSERRLRTALDTMLEGVTMLSAIRDVDGRIVDFRIDYANSAIGAISGTAGSLQTGRTLLELFPAHRTNGLFEAYVHVVETGVPFESGAFRYVDPDAAGGPLDQVLEHRAARLGDGYLLSVRDVTERHRAEREMRRLATAIEQSADAVVITDATGAIEYVNPAFLQVTGYTSAELLGQNPRILKSGVQSPAFYAAMWEALASGGSFVGDLTNRRKDGSLFHEEAVISPIHDDAGAITSYVAVSRNVTRERALEAAQERQARERATVAATLAELKVLPTATATAETICRQVAGLPGVATAGLSYFTLEDPVIGLALVRADGVPGPLPHIPMKRGRALRERAGEGPWVEALVERPWHPYNRLFVELGVKAVAYIPVPHSGQLIGLLIVSSAEVQGVAGLSESLPALLEFAGIAGLLLGPAIVDLTEVGSARARIAQIITARAFRPVFQPVVDVRTGDHVGYEALTRFGDRTRPDIMFAAAASGGLGLELEEATLRAALAAAAQLPNLAWLSLNVSPELLLAGGRLAQLLATTPRPVVLEVTEHTPIVDYAAMHTAIAALGPDVRVAVDDAGSGVANLGHIVELRPAFVKLDISLVRGIDNDLARQAMAVGLLHFASESASETIAEGVETVEELVILRGLGLRLAQGYLLGRPEPAATWARNRQTA